MWLVQYNGRNKLVLWLVQCHGRKKLVMWLRCSVTDGKQDTLVDSDKNSSQSTTVAIHMCTIRSISYSPSLKTLISSVGQSFCFIGAWYTLDLLNSLWVALDVTAQWNPLCLEYIGRSMTSSLLSYSTEEKGLRMKLMHANFRQAPTHHEEVDSRFICAR